MNLKGFYILLFLAAFAARLIYIFSVNTQPISDFKYLFDSAVGFANGDYSFQESIYFKDWAYQTAFVIYEGAVIKIFGAQNAIMVLKILNAFYGAGSCVLIHFIVKGFVSERTARFASLLCMGLIFPVTYAAVLSNQPVSAFFFLAGLAVLTAKSRESGPMGGQADAKRTGQRSRKADIGRISRRSGKTGQGSALIKSALAGLFIAAGNIMRPEGIVVMAALLLAFLFRLLKPENERRSLIVIRALLLAVIYFGANSLASELIVSRGVNPKGLSNNNMLWKFVAGLNYDSNGTFSMDDSKLVYDKTITLEQREAIQRSLIEERLKMGPRKLLTLFVNKEHYLWSGNPLFWSVRHLENKNIQFLGKSVSFNNIENLAAEYHALQMVTLILLSLAGAVLRFKKPLDHKLMVYYLILLMTAVVYLIIEVQTRYVYFPQYALVVTAAIGIEGICEQLGSFKFAGTKSASKTARLK